MSDLTSVKQIAAILYQDGSDFEASKTELAKTFSELDYIGGFFPFVETDYYEKEMGANLVRGIISFKNLVHPGVLANTKQQAKALEDEMRKAGNRRINIDVGYMDLFKVVLASYKGRSNKIYLDHGIWADMILYFDAGDYKSFNWGFPDFKSGIYNSDLLKIRTLYKAQLKEERLAKT